MTGVRHLTMADQKVFPEPDVSILRAAKARLPQKEVKVLETPPSSIRELGKCNPIAPLTRTWYAFSNLPG
jgi:hypothetical protein